ncbi:MAG: ABC transporter substrate-binding protein [Rhizobiaceae bacterium]|jgi:ABC-type nitrate/sulfonate/bicarbonate transport system substrate-binding protein
METTRRQFLAAGAALATLPLCRVSPAFAEALKISMGVGLANEQAAIIRQLQNQKLLEKAAEELGAGQVDAEYLNFPVLLRMLQGIAAGQLQFGNLGSTPCIRTLTSGDPAVPIGIIGGGNTFPLQVPKGSPIKNLDDLKGKTVLTILGSDLHLVLVRMLQAHFGTPDPKELGISVRNINALAELAHAPAGIDAVVSLEPMAGAAEASGDLVTLVRNDGKTGAAYDGPEGKGAGHTIASFSKTPFAPEAYYPHRIWWVVRQEFLKSNPKVVTALLVATARATEALVAMKPAEVVAIGGENWTGDKASQEKWVPTVLWERRGWNWITEGDVKTLVGLSTTKAIFKEELSAEKARKIVGLGADVAKAAYDHVGQKPAAAAFSDTSAGDVRGKPVWEIKDWSL